MMMSKYLSLVVLYLLLVGCSTMTSNAVLCALPRPLLIEMSIEDQEKVLSLPGGKGLLLDLAQNIEELQSTLDGYETLLESQAGYESLCK